MSFLKVLVGTGSRVLEAAKRLQQHNLNDKELEGLLQGCRRNFKGTTIDDRSPIHQAAEDEARYRRSQLSSQGALRFDYYRLPTEDPIAIVRCVHEGVCPTCGRSAYIVHAEDFPGQPVWNRQLLTTVECLNGHKATAEPTEGGDWVGYLG